MRARSAVPGPSTATAPSMDGAFRLVVVMSLVLVAVVGLSVVRGALRPWRDRRANLDTAAPRVVPLPGVAPGARGWP